MADVFFHGIPLENVAGCKITDITVNPIQWAPTARARPIRAGSDFVRLVGGNRTITMTFALLDSDMEARQEALMAVNSWLKTDTPEQLVLPGYPGRYLMAICTEFPEPYLRQWWQELRVTWTAFDPYWVSMTEREANCGVEFEVRGSAPPVMWITDTLTATESRVYSNGSETLSLASIPAGDLIINLNEQTAVDGNLSVMAAISFDSTFPTPRTGTMTITGSGKVHWLERWV